MMREIFTAFLLPLLLPALMWALDGREQQRIDYLLNSVGALDNAVFVRNTGEYDAKTAKEHLQKKLNLAGRQVKTAEDFINTCAAESLFTHHPYTIRFADGTTTEIASFLRQKLKEFDQKNH